MGAERGTPIDANDPAHFGKWLKQRREALDLTQRELGEATGCSLSTIRKMEMGQRRPSKQVAALLVVCLEIAPEEQATFMQFARDSGSDRHNSPPQPLPPVPPLTRRPLSSTSEAPSSPGDDRSPTTPVPAVGVTGSLTGTPHTTTFANLPAYPTSFIGREKTVEQVQGLLWRSDIRLLTLVGPPGIGKTRLAVEVAARLADDFAGGVFFVALAPISEYEWVLPAIAQTLGVRETPDAILLNIVGERIRNKNVLLLLDNFEHVLEAGSVVADLLRITPRLKVLVTSRTRLDLYGEHEFTVPALSVPGLSTGLSNVPGIAEGQGSKGQEEEKATGGGPRVDPSHLESYEAVQLFVRRAQAVHSSFGLTEENAPSVAETCRLLSGLPLAIELAAARTRHMTPQVLAEQLARHGQLELLAGTTRDLPARHRTLKNAIEWSYELLDEGEQKVFRALSIFVGGCTREALEAVCDWRGDPSFTISAPGVSEPYVLDIVASLITKSLLIQQEGAGDEPRLEMLEAIREYSQQRLAESGEANELRLRHARYYLSLVEEAEPELQGSGQGKWLARLDRDYSNIREVLDWAAAGVANEARGSRENSENSTDLIRSSLGLRMTAALWPYWLIHGYVGEGLEYLAKLLSSTEFPAAAAGTGELLVPGYERAGVSVKGGVMTLARAKSLLGMGHLTFVRGNYERARLLLEQSLALHRDLAYKPGIAQTLGNLSLVAREEGRFADAQVHMEQALLILQETGNRWGIANALRELGVLALYQGHNARAITLFEQSLELLRDLGQRWGMAYALVSLGVVMQLEGDSSRAESLLSESLLIGSELGDQHIIAQCLEGLASAAASGGNTTRAAQLWGAAQALRESVGAALSDFDRANHERDIEAARTQVIPGSWEEAWTEGYSQPLKYARQDGAKHQQ